MKFSIVIPVFNEEKTVNEIIRKVKTVKYPGTSEIIVIDDGSTDKSMKILKKVDGIILLKNKKNKGKGYSLRKGFLRAKGEIILIQDADLEYKPEEHLKLIELFKDKRIDVVYGSRFLKGNHKPKYTIFYWGNIFLSLLTRFLYRANITDMETCYKAFKKSVLKKINLTANRFDFEPEITCKLLKIGVRILICSAQPLSGLRLSGSRPFF
jgi:glycosyltransferase involved in cell wall biosynthesis